MCCKYEVALKNLHSDKSPWNADAAGRDTTLWEQSIILLEIKNVFIQGQGSSLDQLRPAGVFKEVRFEPGI